MTNSTASNFSHISEGGETGLPVPVWVSVTLNVIVNSITCPFTVSLNVLVIMAVKRRPRLQSNTNILLACLAVTDATTGLIVQPSFIAWMILKLLGAPIQMPIVRLVNSSSRTLFLISSLLLTLVTFERLIAIKFTMHYPRAVTKKNIKVAVIAFWVTAILSEVFRNLGLLPLVFSNAVTAVALISCIVFVVFSYAILYRETRRHEKKIKAQQLPQEEVERFARERKVLKTTVYVIGAVVICFTPVGVTLVISSAMMTSGDWNYPRVLTKKNIIMAVIAFWVAALSIEVVKKLLTNTPIFANFVTPVVLFSCTVFVVFSYAILYRETRHHEKKIKAQQLPQEKVERFARESKVLKTTVYVIGAVVICFVPMVVFLAVFNTSKKDTRQL